MDGFRHRQTGKDIMTAPRVSCIIAVYNKPDFLEKIFVSLIRQSFNDFEVVVADDGSEKDVADCVDRYKNAFAYPVQHVWHAKKGFRKTIIANKAVIAAKADYLVFIDGDCVLHHRFTERHFAHRRPHTILSGRRVLFDESLTKRLSLADIRTGRMERPGYWLGHCARSDLKNGIYIPFSFEIENLFLAKYTILGCNFSVHKIDFQEINGYDERIIGRGMEDSNLYERFRVKGYRVRTIAREALQYHLFHTFDPVPHSRETIREYCRPTSPWTHFGIIKKDADHKRFSSL
jgi:glycosyltransferase involved in cell wall biosynthesis